jgi:4-amino-4-deoxy-L-arabinose transferase-like glycosyltransferase
MTSAGINAPRVRALDRLIALGERRPETILAWVLGIHLVVWTVLPWLVCPNLQLDLAEDLALGKEWQLGYWKHPPLPWWLADALYRLTGSIHSVYLLGPLAAVACLYVVWLLARDVVGPRRALIAVLTLEGFHFYNFSVIKFAHDQMQLPFWALTGLFFHRALTRRKAIDWALAGVCLALAFWSKYAAFALAATLGIFLLADPVARTAWRGSGPWVMALAFAIVIAPNAWWLVDSGFLPFQYVDARAIVATRWYHYVTHPLQWTGGQILFGLPAIALIALLYWPGAKPNPAGNPQAAFDRRLITTLALGPFAVTTFVALLLGRLPVAMWGYPLWSFAPLAALMWLGPANDPDKLRRFAKGFLAVFIAFPLVYAAIELFEPAFRDRPKATQFPGQRFADIVTAAWHAKYGTPLTYVAGAEFPVNNLAVYSPDRPHVVVHGRPSLSPWIDMNDLRRRGAVIAWEGEPNAPEVDEWRATFPGMELQPPLELPRQTWFRVRPSKLVYAILPPSP